MPPGPGDWRLLRRSPRPRAAPEPRRSSPTGTPCRPRRCGRSQSVAGDAGLEFVDGSISGGPPRPGSTTRIYLSGARAEEIAAATPPEIDARVIGAEIGLASAVKMCTAAMYKGSTALLAHSLLTAHAHGVLPQVLDDLHGPFARQIDSAPRLLAVSATKAERFVGEMREIAATQSSAGLTPALFEGFAEVYAALASSPLGHEARSRSRHDLALEDVLERLAPDD